VLVSTVDKSDETRHVSDQFPSYHMEILFEDFSAIKGEKVSSN
jgi:hypothetical protein